MVFKVLVDSIKFWYFGMTVETTFLPGFTAIFYFDIITFFGIQL